MSNTDRIAELSRLILEYQQHETESQQYGRKDSADYQRCERAYHLHQRGKLYAQDGQFEQAAADQQEAIALGYDEYWVWSSLAKALQELKRFGAAATAYDSAIRRLEADKGDKDTIRLYREERTFCKLEEAMQEYRNGSITASTLKSNVQAILKGLKKTDRDRVLFRVHPVDAVSAVTRLLFGEFPSTPPEIVTLIREEAVQIRELALAWSPQDKYFEHAYFVAALAAYESGDHDTAQTMVAEQYLHRQAHLFGGPDHDRPLTRPSSLIASVPVLTHPLTILAEAYHCCRTAQEWEAIKLIEEWMGKYHPGHPYGSLGMQAVLALAPAAIERHLGKEEWVPAAGLAERLGDLIHAGEWYEKAADSAELQSEQESAVQAYESALTCFRRAGDRERSAACEHKLRRLRGQAGLQIRADILEPLVVGEWDLLSVTVVNVGFGPARNVQVGMEGPITAEATVAIEEIAVGKTAALEIAFRAENAGRAVPITIKVSYEDSVGPQELPLLSKRLRVLRLGESSRDQADVEV